MSWEATDVLIAIFYSSDFFAPALDRLSNLTDADRRPALPKAQS